MGTVLTSDQSTSRALLATGNASALTFSPDSRELVTASTDGTTRISDVGRRTARQLGATEAASTALVAGAAFDPRGATLATWPVDGSVQLWDVRSGTAVGPPLAAPGDGGVLAGLSADGRREVARVGHLDELPRVCPTP